MIANPHDTPAPTLTPRDRDILSEFLHPAHDLGRVCSNADIDIAALIAWAAQPHIAALLHGIRELSRLREEIITSAARVEALAALQAVAAGYLDEGGDPKTRARTRETTRKAASHLLRLPGTQPQRGASTTERASAHSPSPMGARAGGRVQTGATAPERAIAHSPSLREGAGGRVPTGASVPEPPREHTAAKRARA